MDLSRWLLHEWLIRFRKHNLSSLIRKQLKAQWLRSPLLHKRSLMESNWPPIFHKWDQDVAQGTRLWFLPGFLDRRCAECWYYSDEGRLFKAKRKFFPAVWDSVADVRKYVHHHLQIWAWLNSWSKKIGQLPLIKSLIKQSWNRLLLYVTEKIWLLTQNHL